MLNFLLKPITQSMTVCEMRLETLQYHRNLHTRPGRATIAPLKQLWHPTSLILVLHKKTPNNRDDAQLRGD